MGSLFSQAEPAGADDGARTRYLHHGKVALYQMSYIRPKTPPESGDNYYNTPGDGCQEPSKRHRRFVTP
jgi:hypothetical protein